MHVLTRPSERLFGTNPHDHLPLLLRHLLLLLARSPLHHTSLFPSLDRPHTSKTKNATRQRRGRSRCQSAAVLLCLCVCACACLSTAHSLPTFHTCRPCVDPMKTQIYFVETVSVENSSAANSRRTVPPFLCEYIGAAAHRCRPFNTVLIYRPCCPFSNCFFSFLFFFLLFYFFSLFSHLQPLVSTQ